MAPHSQGPTTDSPALSRPHNRWPRTRKAPQQMAPHSQGHTTDGPHSQGFTTGVATLTRLDDLML